jgi:SAM-dependent methyltransferase
MDTAIVTDRDAAGTSHQLLASMEAWHFWFHGRDLLVRTLLRRWVADEGGLMLDVGSGTGWFAARLAESGRDVIALDRQVDSDTESTPAIEGDVEFLPLASDSLRVVLARDVLEHVDDARALLECHRVLQPGGILIVLVPGWPSLWSDRDIRAGHLRRYRRAQLRDVLERSGFGVLDLRGYQFLLLPVILVSRAITRRRGEAQLISEESPSRTVNRIFRFLNSIEARAAAYPRLRLPTGSTLVAVCERV